MKNTKKGFTLVELLVVIAILAILATVSIVGYTSFIDRAHESNDVVLAEQLNSLLVAETATGTKMNTFNEVITFLRENGFDVGKLNPTAEDNYYVWDSESNQILYVDSKNPTEPIYSDRAGYGSIDKWWLPISSLEKVNDVFSNYLLTETESLSESKTYTRPIGLAILTGKTLATTDSYGISINVPEGTSGTITIDGNISGTVNINAPDCDFKQYGTVENLNIQAIANNSAHIYGFVQTLIHKGGRLVIEEEGYVYILAERVPAESEKGKVDIYGIVYYVAETSNADYEKHDGAVWLVNEEAATLPENIEIGVEPGYTWKVSSVEDLIRFRDAVNSGFSFSGITVELTSDLDLSHMNWTIPIGYAVTYTEGQSIKLDWGNLFQGTFDGNNHTIKGLTIIDMPRTGYGGGLFGLIYNATIKNLKLIDVNINSDKQSSPLVAYLYNSTADNIYVSGTAESQWTAGLANYAQGATVKNCTIDVDFIANGYDTAKDNYVRLGGVIGQGKGITIENTDVSNCTFTLVGRSAKVGYFVGGYIGQHNDNTSYIDYDRDPSTPLTAVKGISNDGDSDPSIVGIETINYAGQTENVDLWTNYHTKPADLEPTPAE